MNKLIAALLGLAFVAAAACDNKGGMAGCGGGGDGSQYCASGTKWNGTECVKSKK